MKLPTLSLYLWALTSLAQAEYVDESPLPEGWPKPGPYGEVSEKSYPAYRAAFSEAKTPGKSGWLFWTLFQHIKKEEIAMTAPVEMPMTVVENDEGDALMEDGMAFLYRTPDMGETGEAKKNVEVRDLPKIRVLSYAWNGPSSDEWIAKARAALDAAIEQRGTPVQTYRLLGYNSPGVPNAKKTHELQAVLEVGD